jgi:hypothetical protein
VTLAWRRLRARLRRSTRLAREITLVLVVKTLLLSLLFNVVPAREAPRRVDAGQAAQHLLGKLDGP